MLIFLCVKGLIFSKHFPNSDTFPNQMQLVHPQMLLVLYRLSCHQLKNPLLVILYWVKVSIFEPHLMKNGL